MIAPLLAGEVAAASRGTLLAGSPTLRFAGVSIDTRTIEPGFLFFAIRGPNHDAHGFLDEALASGAAGLVVEDASALPAERPAGAVVVRVADTTAALADVAAAHRSGFRGPVVAITGSNGKTTTKEMCAAILGRSGPCLATRGNLNNEYGLPLTLLRRREADRTAVVELGMNHRGEIARLAAIARADVGVVTNVGTAHIEHLGSREEIAREKADLLAAIVPEGTAILHGDDPLLRAEASRVRARLVTFGLDSACDVRAEKIERCAPGRFAFEWVTGAERRRVEVEGLHEGTVPNALAAAAGARAAGASSDDVVEGLAAYRPAPGRMNLVPLADGVWLVDDTYNANPQSMEAALRGLAELSAGGRAFAALGDMGELGDTADAAHREAGRLAGALGLAGLGALGERAEQVLAGARDAGLAPDAAFAARDADELVERLAAALRRGDCVLVKGSRAMRMERVVRGLLERRGAA
ncbi:MAG TPA: UDP-N-acetylmuramoyl-tripeptide--D-alanyl-D-alanine ligase [Myxococcota bacterium]|nr:UDP-N-acetylmuramoyl-tripeptide--D-alanyl-D-alanine ligase [Myxococcota bacterium]